MLTTLISRYLLPLAVLVISGLLAGCDNAAQPAPQEHRTVTDLLGRSVTIPPTPRRVACIGAGALRLFTYAGDLDRLCGVEQCEKRFLISARPYRIVHQKLFEGLPSIGLGGPTGHPDAEALLKARPDLVFTTYTLDPPALDRLQRKINAPVLALSYGQAEATDPQIRQSLTLIGQVMETDDKARLLTDYILDLQADLQRRTRDIPPNLRKTAYLACHSHFGSKGFGSSTADFSLFNAVNARNVLREHGYKGYQKQIQLEAILRMNPQVIIVDAAGLAILREEVKHHSQAFEALSAFQQGHVYAQLPYNAYHTNLELAYANAYFIGKILYPMEFKDVNMKNKADEISRHFLGEDTYEKTTRQVGGGFRKLTLRGLLQEKQP